VPGRLGLEWDRDDRSAPGLKVVRVVPEAPAARAGFRVGDRILSFAGNELAHGADLAALVVAAENPVKALVARAGTAEPVEIAIQLRGQPTKLGILWREDDAEPGSVKLVGVVPGSPADRARLRPLDRIYAINGQEFANGAALREMLSGITTPYELLVESGGKVRTAVIETTKPADVPQSATPTTNAPQ
jgi:C-terminal processing protease CtpA/Prc